MFKQLSITLTAVSAVLILWTNADAGCARIGGKRVCASYITGGSEVGLVTATGFGNNNDACPAVESSQGGGGEEGPALSVASLTSSTQITQMLVGTDGKNCGIGKNELCDIRGVVFCGSAPTSTLGAPTTKHGDDDDDDDNGNGNGRRTTTAGPLTVVAPGFAQSDGSGRNFAGFRFQLDSFEQEELCGNKPFITFIAQEGFFETCVDDGFDNVCVKERCTVNLGGVKPDDLRVYQCKRI